MLCFEEILKFIICRGEESQLFKQFTNFALIRISMGYCNLFVFISNVKHYFYIAN